MAERESPSDDGSTAEPKKKSGRGGRRPGAGRKKGSGGGKRRKHYMFYLSSEEAVDFEYFCATVGLSPYLVLKRFALAVIDGGLEELGDFLVEGDRGDVLSFSVSAKFTARHPGFPALGPEDFELDEPMDDEVLREFIERETEEWDRTHGVGKHR